MDCDGSVVAHGKDEGDLTDLCKNVEDTGSAWVGFIARERAASHVHVESSPDPPGSGPVPMLLTDASRTPTGLVQDGAAPWVKRFKPSSSPSRRTSTDLTGPSGVEELDTDDADGTDGTEGEGRNGTGTVATVGDGAEAPPGESGVADVPSGGQLKEGVKKLILKAWAKPFKGISGKAPTSLEGLLLQMRGMHDEAQAMAATLETLPLLDDEVKFADFSEAAAALELAARDLVGAVARGVARQTDRGASAVDAARASAAAATNTLVHPAGAGRVGPGAADGAEADTGDGTVEPHTTRAEEGATADAEARATAAEARAALAEQRAGTLAAAHTNAARLLKGVMHNSILATLAIQKVRHPIERQAAEATRQRCDPGIALDRHGRIEVASAVRAMEAMVVAEGFRKPAESDERATGLEVTQILASPHRQWDVNHPKAVCEALIPLEAALTNGLLAFGEVPDASRARFIDAACEVTKRSTPTLEEMPDEQQRFIENEPTALGKARARNDAMAQGQAQRLGSLHAIELAEAVGSHRADVARQIADHAKDGCADARFAKTAPLRQVLLATRGDLATLELGRGADAKVCVMLLSGVVQKDACAGMGGFEMCAGRGRSGDELCDALGPLIQEWRVLETAIEAVEEAQWGAPNHGLAPQPYRPGGPIVKPTVPDLFAERNAYVEDRWRPALPSVEVVSCVDVADSLLAAAAAALDGHEERHVVIFIAACHGHKIVEAMRRGAVSSAAWSSKRAARVLVGFSSSTWPSSAAADVLQTMLTKLRNDDPLQAAWTATLAARLKRDYASWEECGFFAARPSEGDDAEPDWADVLRIEQLAT